jgi:site-specific DNA-cytosine methylase
MNKPVAFIDLFCGMGGFTVGAINAGATCIMSVDNWNEVCAVHRANHSTIPVTQMELGHPDHWRFFKRMVDDYRSRGYHIHIHGSPPCQALSNASTRSAEEGMPLVLWYLDLVEKCEPDSWSMENVVPVRKKLTEGVPSVVLNSADFGVPQTRRRCYAGEGWAACPSHTKDEWVSVIEALPHLEGELTENINPNIRQRPITEPHRSITSRSNGQVRLETPVKIRSLTLPETLTLQGFNPDYDLSAARTMKSRWTMVGNAVPPPVAEAVIRGIANAEAN